MDVVELLIWALTGLLLGFWATALCWLAREIGLFALLRLIARGEVSPRELLPPYTPPSGGGMWWIMSKLRLCPGPKLPCGCSADWDDIYWSNAEEADDDGTVYDTIGDFIGCETEWRDLRGVEADNGGVYVYEQCGVQVEEHLSCGGTWTREAGITDDRPALVEVIDPPTPSQDMRGLPDGWTRMDSTVIERAGQVSEYANDRTWEAFVDVFETGHVGNDYDPSRGTYCAVLFTGTPDSGLWEQERRYANDANAAAKPLMEQYNEDLEGDDDDE